MAQRLSQSCKLQPVPSSCFSAICARSKSASPVSVTLTEHARILSAVVVNDRPVELLARTAALADLEILDTVGTMRHCLQRCRL